MSRDELLDDLRRQGDDKAKAVWAEVEESAQKLRDELEQKYLEEKSRVSREQERKVSRMRKKILNQGRHKARKLRLESTQALAERLLRVARRSLSPLRRQEGDGLFAALATELPDLPWDEVRVHPEDEKRARDHFPRARITTDPEISGGMVALSEELQLVVDNSLDRRLERAWPTLLPRLLDALREDNSE